MAPGIGAAGVLGVALETTSGTYLAPTTFIPFESESLNYVQETIWRRPIRQSAEIIGAVPGNVHVEGDIGFEAIGDAVATLLHAARHTVVKTGATAPYSYKFTPNANAIPVKTLSLTVVRNGIVFGYTGMVVSSFTFTIEDGILKFNCSFQGRDEAVQTAPTVTWPTATPFGAGMYDVQIPLATTVVDCDTFEFTVEQNAEPQFRLKSAGQRGAQFIKYGENNVTLSVERDFQDRTDYDAFKAMTAQVILLKAVKVAVTDEIDIKLLAAIKDTYEVAMPSQGDLVRASISYQGVADATGASYEVTVYAAVNIT